MATKTTTPGKTTKKTTKGSKPAPAAKAKAPKTKAAKPEATPAAPEPTEPTEPTKPEATKTPKAMREPKQPKQPRQPKARKVSGLDLAAKVLTEAGEPLDARTIAERVIAAGWKTSGATPHATFYAAIGREIATKGKDARFQKVDRGLFTTTNTTTNAKKA